MKPNSLDLSDARSYVVRLLARREYSQHEIRDRMALKGYDADVITQVFAWLVQHDLQSDERFCENFISYRIRAGYGPLWIKSALRDKGVDQATVFEFLPEDSEFWCQEMLVVWNKKFAAPADTPKAVAKQIRFLVGRGFYAAQATSLVLSQRDKCIE